MLEDEESPETEESKLASTPALWLEPPSKRFSTKTSRKDEEVLQVFFHHRPTVNTDHLAVTLTARQTGRTEAYVEKVIGKYCAKEEAKKQRREYADEIYREKIPLSKTIVTLSLDKLAAFIETFEIQNIDDAKGLSKIATDMNMLLRLELGQSTNITETVQKTEKSVQTLLGELKEVDPFVIYADYTEVNDGNGNTQERATGSGQESTERGEDDPGQVSQLSEGEGEISS